MPRVYPVKKLNPQTAHDLANMTTREFCQEYGKLPEQVRNMRERYGILLSDEARIRSDQERGINQSRKLNLREMIAKVESEGFRVSKASPREPIIRLEGKPGAKYKMAVVCCTHLGNHAQQITFLHDFYRHAEEQGYEEFWHAGDATDGPDSMHRGIVHEHFLHTIDEVVDYFAEVYPKPKNGFTRMILGNHDESWLKDASGSDIGKRIALVRDDIKYVGRRAADIHIGPVRVYMIHGAGANTYARSYKLQKMVESFAPVARPHVLIAGNWHQPAHIPSLQGVESFLLPSFEHSTPFIKSLGKGDSVIGGLLVELELGQKGLRDIKVQWRLYDVALRGDYPK
jgi:hypothetical protein